MKERIKTFGIEWCFLIGQIECTKLADVYLNAAAPKEQVDS